MQKGRAKKATAIWLFRATDRTQGESIYNYFTGFIPGQACIKKKRAAAFLCYN